MIKETLFTLLFLLAGFVGYGQKTTPQPIRIGLFADIQYYDGPTAGSRHYRHSLQKIPLMLKQFNQEDLTFLVDLGDRIDRDFHSFQTVEDLLKASKHPIIFVPGNHDYSVRSLKKFRIASKSGYPGGYHSMTIGNWRLIFLNGLDNSMIANPWFTPKYWKARQHLSELKAKKAPNAYDWNGGLGKKQTIWFQFQVQLAQDENQNIAVFCHQPLFPGNAHSLWNNDQVLQELSLFPGEVWWISGHDHRGGYQEVKGVHLLTLHGMVEGTEPSFGILEIQESQVNLLGFGDQSDLLELKK